MSDERKVYILNPKDILLKDGEHWWCSLFEKPDEAALWASTINPYSVGISPPGSVVETSDKPFFIDVPLSERGFGV